mgnify:FL=1
MIHSDIFNFYHYTIDSQHTGLAMRRVLHVGPCNTPGGMSKVIEILSQNPPDRWVAETLQSHIVSNPIAKYFFHRSAIKQFIQIITGEKKPDVVHIHTAADWSWKRKSAYVSLCKRYNMPCILHIHSGNFVNWLGKQNSQRCQKFRKATASKKCRVVVLNNAWKENLEPLIGDCQVIQNPIDPLLPFNENTIRQKQQILFLGRDDPVKGRKFAIDVFRELKKTKYPNLKMFMSGKADQDSAGIETKKWFSEEEKLRLLQQSSLILMPSKYEGQSLVMLEALHCGLPCIISDTVLDLPDSVIVAKHEDLRDWIEKVSHTLENSTDSKSLNQAVSNHQIDQINQQWHTLYHDLSS